MLPAAPLARPMPTRSAEVAHGTGTGDGAADDGAADEGGAAGAGDAGADEEDPAGLGARGGLVVFSCALSGCVATRVGTVVSQAAASRAERAMTAAAIAARPERGGGLIGVSFLVCATRMWLVTDRTLVGPGRLFFGGPYWPPLPGWTVWTARMRTAFDLAEQAGAVSGM